MNHLEKAGLTLLHLVAASLKLSKAGQAQPSEISNGITKLAVLAAEDLKFAKDESQKALETVIASLKDVLPDLHEHLNPIAASADSSSPQAASKDANSTFSFRSKI